MLSRLRDNWPCDSLVCCFIFHRLGAAGGISELAYVRQRNGEGAFTSNRISFYLCSSIAIHFQRGLNGGTQSQKGVQLWIGVIHFMNTFHLLSNTC